MNPRRVAVIGGGAAGFFAAITCAEAAPGAEVIVLEKTSRFLDKVRISGGGRCNVTHACFDPRLLAEHYPRGGPALVGLFHRFQPRDTIAWFASRGVKLKTESDGRMFPVTDSSRTVIECLLDSARESGVILRLNSGVDSVKTNAAGQFELNTRAPSTAASLESATVLTCDRLLLATGGCRSETAGRLPLSLGHTLVPPVPSLFTFHIEALWVRELAGVSMGHAELSVPDASLSERGAVLFTHSGLSGPAVLRLSAWGARSFHERNYKFPIRVNWIAPVDTQTAGAEFDAARARHAARFIANTPLFSLPARLWEKLLQLAGLSANLRWAALPKNAQHRLVRQLTRTDLEVSGKSLNKEEFVTCGGVPLTEVNLKTMESRLRPGLHFAGELLDIDGVTGGFNFQAAWTTGWIAGNALARA